MSLDFSVYLDSADSKEEDQPPTTVEQVINRLGCGEGLRRLALDVLSGQFAKQLPADAKAVNANMEEYFDFLNGWLRFVVRDQPVERMRWEYLSRPGKDLPAISRDAYLADLWRRIEDPATVEHGLIDRVTRKWSPWSYYQRLVYYRFLGRFDLVNAWRVIPFSMLFCKDDRPYFVFQSLIPRLAAAVGIGFLFLASAPQLPKAIALANPGPWSSTGGVATLLGTAFLFLVLHISRRIHPPIPFPELARRAGLLLLLALIYTLGVGIAALPLLYSPAIQGTRMCTEFGTLALCAALALNLGVLLQLAWDEKPLTEPL